MEIKHYTPSLDDLREGYEFEYQVYDEEKDEYTDEWRTMIFDSRAGLGHDMTHSFSDGRVRVPYLNVEELVSEGWVPETILIEDDETEEDKFVNGFTKYISEDHWFEVEILPDQKLKIIEKHYRNQVTQLWRTRYDGSCPTINDFRTLCKWLKIK